MISDSGFLWYYFVSYGKQYEFYCSYWTILSVKEIQTYLSDLEIVILFILTNLSSYYCFCLNSQLRQNSSVENYLLECTGLKEIYKFTFKEY